jgi:hypothetical protein
VGIDISVRNDYIIYMSIKRRIAKPMYDLAACLYQNEGMSLLQLADLIGVTWFAVRLQLITRGVVLKPKGPYINPDSMASRGIPYWKNRNKPHCNSRVYLNTYVKKGKIIRSPYCEICLKDCKTEGHHDDHSKWREVLWVCFDCHRKLEKTLRLYPQIRNISGDIDIARRLSSSPEV